MALNSQFILGWSETVVIMLFHPPKCWDYCVTYHAELTFTFLFLLVSKPNHFFLSLLSSQALSPKLPPSTPPPFSSEEGRPPKDISQPNIYFSKVSFLESNEAFDYNTNCVFKIYFHCSV